MTVQTAEFVSWRQRAECRSYDPDLWFTHTPNSPGAQAAKKICQGCKVRVECAREALDTSERWAICGGFHTRSTREWRMLHAFLGLPQPTTRRTRIAGEIVPKTCPTCGAEFEAPNNSIATQCEMCRNDFVLAGPTRARVTEVYAELKTFRATGAALGISNEQVKRILDGVECVKRSTEAKVLGAQIAKAS